MNRGAQLLRQRLRRHQAGMVAAECWTTIPTVDDFANGKQVPEYAFRKKLERLLDIPVGAWLEPEGELVF